MRTLIGVMGGGTVDAAVADMAEQLGALIAAEGWVLVTGGRACGVMDAASQGAQDAGGLTVGILPDADHSRMSAHVDIPILTGLGDARNVLNVLTSHVVIALPGAAGTISEVAHALRAERPLITLGMDLRATFADAYADGSIRMASTPEEAIALAHAALEDTRTRAASERTRP